MFHYLLILFKFGLIKKYTCILTLHSKLFSTVYVKLGFDSRFKRIDFSQNCKKLIVQKTSFFHLFKKIVKITIRVKKTLDFKKLKYGILINKKNFKTNHRNRIQRSWHKFWHKCLRYNLNKTFPKMKIMLQKTVLENCSFKFFFPRKINIFYFKKFQKNRLVAFFFLRFESYIRKILIAKEEIVYNLLMFLNIFRGYVSYKVLHFFLTCLENFRGIYKLTEQIGRQKILQFHYTKRRIVCERKTLQISNVTEKTTQQVLKRRVMLLLWLKNNFLYVKNLGKKVAAFENKGLRRIDTKVIYRILSDLIRLGFIKIIKIYIQLYYKKIKIVEFIAEKNNDIFSFKKAINIFSQNIESMYGHTKEKKSFYYIDYRCLFFKLRNFFSSKKKLEKTNFMLKTSYILIPTIKKNIQFVKNRIFLNLYFNFQKIFILFILDLKKAYVFDYFNLKKKINFFKNFLLKKIFLTRKRLSFNIFFYNFSQKFHQAINKKTHIIVTSRFSLKEKFFNLIKNSIFFSYSEIFLSKNFFIYKLTNNFKQKQYPAYKWDCEIDVKIYSYFVCLFFKKNKQNNYRKLSFLRQGFYRRRIGRLKLIPNVKTIYSFFEKTFKFSKTLYFRNSIRYLYQIIKRSLEFPSNYFFLNILVNKSTFFIQLTRNLVRVSCMKNVLYEINSENIFYLIWRFLFKKIFSLCNFIFKGFLLFFYQRFTFIHLHFLVFAVKDFQFLKKKEKKNSNFFLKLKKGIFFYLFFTKLFKEKKAYSVLYKDLLKKKIFLDIYNKNKLAIMPFFIMNRFIYAQKFQKKKEKTSMEVRVSFHSLYTNCEKKPLILVQTVTKQKRKNLEIFKKFISHEKKVFFSWDIKVILNKKTNKIIKETLPFFKNKNLFDTCLNNFLEFRSYIIFWTYFDIAFCLQNKKNLDSFIFNFIFKKTLFMNQFYNEMYFLASFFSSEHFFQDVTTFQKIGSFFTSFYSFKKKITLLRYQYKINSVNIDHKDPGHGLFNCFVLY
nr:hypothetical protein CparaKRNrm3_p118 [Cryptomonas paramecium]